MNRDAKIGIVVILIIVVVLVIVWGRADEPVPEEIANADRTDQDLGQGGSSSPDDGAPDTLAINDEILYSHSGSDPLLDGSLTDPTDQTPPDDFTAESPPTRPVTPPEREPWTYTVKEGDTLGKIADEQLGDRTRWQEIAKLNPQLADPDDIKPGDKLKMPGRGTPGSTAAAPVTPAVPVTPTGPHRTYVVQEGDSLTLIAEEQLGDPSRMKEIADLNQLADPNKIKPGQKLLLPK